jgi:hypothetical protein
MIAVPGYGTQIIKTSIKIGKMILMKSNLLARELAKKYTEDVLSR